MRQPCEVNPASSLVCGDGGGGREKENYSPGQRVGGGAGTGSPASSPGTSRTLRYSLTERPLAGGAGANGREGSPGGLPGELDFDGIDRAITMMQRQFLGQSSQRDPAHVTPPGAVSRVFLAYDEIVN